jgi:hypothetical protein
MRRVRRDHDQIPGLQEIFLAIAQAARFPLDNRPHRELRVAVALIGLAAARCCAAPATADDRLARRFGEYLGYGSLRPLLRG